ncbi:alpha-(1,3)-fucosyltransferase 7-like isoform X2 [Artemia franciscana]
MNPVLPTKIVRLLNKHEKMCRTLFILQVILAILLSNYIFVRSVVKKQVIYIKQENSVNVFKQGGKEFYALATLKQKIKANPTTTLMPSVEELWEFRKSWPRTMKSKLSMLGRRMFLGDFSNQTQQNRNFKIAVWHFGSYLERRFLKWFSTESHPPFDACSVNNCEIIYASDNSKLKDVDGVLFHLHRTAGVESLPKYRTATQRWIFMTDENPFNTFLLSKTYTMRDFNSIFNWSMTYRYDSDIPVPYGRVIPLPEDENISLELPTDYTENKKKLVAIYASDCIGKNDRWNYIQDLKQFIQVDIIGRCGPKNCTIGSKMFGADCPLLRQYKFYLAFENANCDGYITEKFWFNPFDKNIIPVVMGPTKLQYELFAPANSFIHVDDFESPKELANYLLKINDNSSLYNSFFEWKAKFKQLNEHGYFGIPNFHYCRICEALNYNSKEQRVYDDLEKFWDYRTDCKQ